MLTIDRATIAEDGTLKLPKEALELLGSHVVKIDVEQGRVVLEARPRVLHDIEDPEERKAVYEAFKAQIMRPGAGPLPATRAELNDLVYD